jgi:hypothetical protein
MVYSFWAVTETVPNCDDYLDGNERKVGGGLMSEVPPFAESGFQSSHRTFPYEFVSNRFLRKSATIPYKRGS